MSRVRDRLTASLALRFTLLRTTGAYNAAVVSVAACPCRARARYARSYVGIRGFPAESWVQVVNSPKADHSPIKCGYPKFRIWPCWRLFWVLNVAMYVVAIRLAVQRARYGGTA